MQWEGVDDGSSRVVVVDPSVGCIDPGGSLASWGDVWIRGHGGWIGHSVECWLCRVVCVLCCDREEKGKELFYCRIFGSLSHGNRGRERVRISEEGEGQSCRETWQRWQRQCLYRGSLAWCSLHRIAAATIRQWLHDGHGVILE